jgi:RNA polymerase sigma factor (sigma-70 family)
VGGAEEQSGAGELAARRLQAVRAGEPGAWEALVDAYGGLIYAIARKSGLRPFEAEEVYAETWRSLFLQIQVLKRPAALIQWIATTARRQSRFALHARLRQPEEDLGPPEVESLEPEPPASLAQLEEAQIVRDAALAMAEPCKSLLAALFFERETPSYAEVGKRIGVPKDSVGRKRELCLAELAARLERADLL